MPDCTIDLLPLQVTCFFGFSAMTSVFYSHTHFKHRNWFLIFSSLICAILWFGNAITMVKMAASTDFCPLPVLLIAWILSSIPIAVFWSGLRNPPPSTSPPED